MRIYTIVKGIAALTLLGSFNMAQAAHNPSPCAAGEPGAGTNCIYMVLNGTTTPSGGYLGAPSGDRADASASLSYGVDVWIDFRTQDYTGGGFSIIFDTTNVDTSGGDPSFAFTATWDDPPFSSTGTYVAGFGIEGIQVNSASGINVQDLLGTLNLTVTTTGPLDFRIVFEDSLGNPYTPDTFPSCFSAGDPTCAPINGYGLTVNAVPLPAAVWMMIAGLGSLAGFSRRKAA